MGDYPLVSVLLPVLNGGPFLRAALDSIVGQSLGSWELVVVLQGRDTADEELLSGYDEPRFRIIRLPGVPGLATALNVGLAECQGEFVARFDADDVSEPHRLELQYRVLCARTELVMLGSAATLVDEQDLHLGIRPVPVGIDRVRRRLLWTNCVIHPSVMFRPAAVKAAGGYDPHLDRSEDYDLWLRMLTVGELDNLSDPLIRLRLHPQQLSRGYAFGFDSLRAISRSRHRAAGDSPTARVVARVQDATDLANRLRHSAAHSVTHIRSRHGDQPTQGFRL